MKHGLINPPVEAEACREMIMSVRSHLERAERAATTSFMQRDEYAQNFGAIQALRKVLVSVEDVYKRRFEV